MLIFRLTRVGKKNRPYYRIVVAEHTAPIKGKFVEIVGNYDPIAKKIVLKKELINAWLSKGVKPTNTVAKLMTQEGVKHKLIVVKTFKKKAAKKKEGQETTTPATSGQSTPPAEETVEAPKAPATEEKVENK